MSADNESIVNRLQELGADAPEASSILGELWEQNINLVRRVVREVSGLPYGSQGFEDMEQQAYFGFHAAVYSYNGGAKFSTYAAQRIKWELIRFYENNGFCIRVPSFMRERLRKVLQKQKELAETNGRAASIAEAAAALGLSKEQAQAVETAMQRLNPESLDAAIGGEDDDITRLDLIAAEESTEDDFAPWHKELHDILQKALADLPEAQRRVIVRKYYNGVTLRQQAKELGISYTAVIDRQKKGLRRMRSGRYAAELADFAPTRKARDEWKENAERERKALANALDRLALSDSVKGMLLL